MAETILIVDDESDNLENLREAFEFHGYRVVTAPNGAVALDRLREAAEPPCAAIVDVLMPVMDGAALYAAMKSDPELTRVAVIFCTSAPSKAPAGAIVLKKPIDLTRLITVVRTHCPQ